MATGDITACRVLATGWEAEVDIAGLATGGTYLMDGSGATLTDIATAKVVFTVVSEGYNAAGELGTKTRTVYGTRARQKAYPNHAAAEEAEADGTLTVTLALSDYIYDDDNTGEGKSGTAPTVTVGAGFYTKTGVPNNATTALAVTNNSTQDYPKAIARWAVVPYQRVTTTFDLECVAFHRFAEYGKPVACVVFSHTDAATDAVAATAMVKSSAADSLPCYRRTIAASNYTDDTSYDFQFTAYPWVGDADSVLTTVGGTANALTLGPLPLLMDPDDDYGVTYAAVVVGGSDSGTKAFNSIAAAQAAPCGTIRYALAQIAAYNNTNYSRNNADCGVILLQSNNHSWGNGTGTATTTNSWVTVTRDPNVARSNAKIAGVSAGVMATALLRITDCTLAPEDTLIAGAAGRTIWFDAVDTVSGTGSQMTDPPVTGYDVSYYTHCTSDLLDYAFSSYGVSNQQALVRGCAATNVKWMGTAAYGPRCCVTTTLDHANNALLGTTVFAFTYENTIFAYNRDLANPMTTSAHVSGSAAISHVAFICNLIEDTAGATSMAVSLWSDNNVAANSNVLMWHNTTAGQRWNMGYNDGAANTARSLYSMLYNSNTRWATKHDVSATDGAQIGAWSIAYGVGFRGNHAVEEWIGGSDQAYYCGVACSDNEASDYTSDQSLTTSGDGNGIYTTGMSSPLRGKIATAAEVVIPWDLAGVAYVPGGAAGAYTFATGGGYLFWTYS